MKEHSCGFFSQHAWELSSLCAQAYSPAALREALQHCFLRLVNEQGISHFMISMDCGAPLEAVEVLLSLRAQHPITLECLIPFEEQHADWSEEDRERYFGLIAQCDHEHMMQHNFSMLCYRNSAQYLLSQCGTLVVLWNGRIGDAGDAVRLARQKTSRLILLDPCTLEEH